VTIHASVDPIKFEVIRSGMTQVAEEMAATLRRSAYSTNVKTRQDFSCAFFDRNLRPVAQAFTQPVHLGSFVRLIPHAVKTYGPKNLAPGDMLVVNDPYSGGSHLNDVTVLGPVHHKGELVGYVASLAHHVDVGGGAPASIGPFREIFQEGIIIPPVKLVRGGRIDDDVFRLILAQIRSKRVTAGDFRAQVAANSVGAKRLSELYDKHGVAEFDSYVDEVIEYTSRRALANISNLPRGRYEAEGFVDFDGFSSDVVNLKLAITVDESGVLFDMTGCDPQRRAPVNSSYAMTFSACAYTLRALMDPDMPVNEGFYRHIKLIAPEGTVVNARHPAPIVGGWETQVRLNDLMFKALSISMPEDVAAGCKAMMAQAGFGIIDPQSGEYHCNYEALAGGYGARATKDGPDAVQQHGQNTENAPVEEIETHFPMRISRLSLIENSDGPGKFRGGLGLRRDYHFPGTPATFTVLSDRDHEGPHGLFGGDTGRKAYYILNPDGGTSDLRELTSKCVVDIAAGDTVSFQTPGGGGYGHPSERDPALVLKDVLNGKVSSQRAREIYRVAVDEETGRVDEKETALLRSKS
jgi:N-methylhydantoinase B